MLGDVAELAVGFPFKSAGFTTDPAHVRLLRGDNVAQRRVRWDGVKRWPSTEAEDFGNYLLVPGDIVLAMDRPWIEAGLKWAALVDEDCPSLLVQRVLRLRARRDFDQRFLAHVIGSPSFTDYVLAVQTGTAVPHISAGQVAAYSFEAPALAEQRRIAGVLQPLDDKIELNRRMNETLEAMAQTIFRDWFVDFGPVRRKLAGATDPVEIMGGLARDADQAAKLSALFPDTLQESEQMPSGWRAARIGDICANIFSGGTPNTQMPEYWNGGIPWLSSGETRSLTIDCTERTISESGVRGSSTRFARQGSTVIASAGQGNTRGQTSFLASGMYINQSVISVEADNNKITDTLLFLDIIRRYDQIRQISDSNSSRGSLTTKMVAGLEVALAPPATVHVLSQYLEPLVQKIILNERESRTLAETRDYLLPRLMSGEVKVGGAIQEAAA